MFKALDWKQVKENRYKAVVNISSGAFKNHIVYDLFLHKGEYWRVMVSGPSIGILDLEFSATKEEAMEKANVDYETNMTNLYNAIMELKES